MKKLLAILLAVLLTLSLAIPAFAFPEAEEGDGLNESYGIAEGYVCTKQATRNADGSTYGTYTTYNKQGQPLKTVEKGAGEDYAYTITTKYTYDKKGNLLKEVDCFSDFVTTTTYTYKSGNVAKKVQKTVFEDGDAYEATRSFTYNKAGLVTKEIAYFDDCAEQVTYTYDKAGRETKKLETRDYEDNTRTTVTTTHTYDKNGNETKMSMVEKDRYGAVEKRVRTSVYAKDLCTKMTETWSFTNNKGNTDTSRDVTTYTYDKQGNVTKEVFKSADSGGGSLTVAILCTYDADGNCIKRVTTEKSDSYSTKSTVVYTFEGGRLVKESTTIKDNDGTTKTAETYAYDKAGNLIKYVYSYKYPDGEAGKHVTNYAYQKIGK